MISEFGSNLENMGINIEDYLREIKKTIDDFKVEWKAEAEKRAKIQLILKKISDEEKISVDESQVNKEVEAILNQYKDADKSSVDTYVRNILQNESVWQFLEKENS
jgi:trigger factor